MWRGEWIPCSSWKLHPTVGSTSPNSFKHAWDKNRAYFLKIGCFFVFGVFGASVWRGEWIPCSSWKLHPTVGATSPNSVKHAWDKNRAYFLKIGCFFVFGILGASVWRGEWIPCSSWKLHPTVGSTSPNSFKHAWDKNRAYFLKIGCFLFLVFLGLLCGVVSGSPVAPGSYTQQWPLQAPIPSSMLGSKSGLFLKNMCFFVFGLLGASVWHGEWSPSSSWKLCPAVALTSSKALCCCCCWTYLAYFRLEIILPRTSSGELALICPEVWYERSSEREVRYVVCWCGSSSQGNGMCLSHAGRYASQGSWKATSTLAKGKHRLSSSGGIPRARAGRPSP